MNGPIWRIALRYANRTRVLTRRVRAFQRRNIELAVALKLANDACDKARDELAQARRDNALLALMARDKEAAAAFLGDAHAIDGLEEAS